MKPSHIGLLQCIECAGALALIDDRTTRAQDDSIKQGVLRCQHCGELFPIIDGVVVFFKKMLLPLFLTDYEKRVCVSLGIAVGKVPEDLTEETLLTKRVADNWSYQWNTESPWGKEDFDKDDYRGDHFFRKFTQ